AGWGRVRDGRSCELATLQAVTRRPTQWQQGGSGSRPSKRHLEAVSMAGERKTHTAALKAQVALAAVRGDRTLREVAVHYGVHRTLIHAWKRRLLTGAEAVFADGKAAGLMESLLQEYREMRALEHQAFLLMGRFVLAEVLPEGLKGLLSDRLPPN